MNLLVILLILLLVFGGLGGYGYRSGLYNGTVYGSGLGLVVLIVVVLLVLGRL